MPHLARAATTALGRSTSSSLRATSRSQSLPAVESEPVLLPQDLEVLLPPHEEDEKTMHVVGETIDGVRVKVPAEEAKALTEGKTVLAVGGGIHAKDASGAGCVAWCVQRLTGRVAEQVIMDEETAKMNEEFSRLQVPLASDTTQHVRRYVRSTHEPELEDYYFSSFTLFRFANLLGLLNLLLTLLFTAQGTRWLHCISNCGALYRLPSR